jgi:hypothetical protein
VTGPDGQGEVADTVLGIGGVVVVTVVATLDEATLGLAASINVMATAATTTSLRIMPIGSIGQGLEHPRATPIGRVPERATSHGPAVSGVDEIECVR